MALNWAREGMKVAWLIPALLFSTLCFSITSTLAISWSKPGCQEKCGTVTIPYPFGVGSDCSANSSFTVMCQNSTNMPPTPFLSSINLEVVNISVHGAVIVNLPVSPMNCSDEQRTKSLPISLEGTPFTISAQYNSLVAMGCKNSVWLPTNATAVEECTPWCNASSTDTTCNGVNCCQIDIPTRLQELQFNYESIHVGNSSFCGYVTSTDKKWLQNEVYKEYKGLVKDLTNPFDPEFGFAPLVLEWELDSICYFESIQMRHINNSDSDYVSSIRYCSCGSGYEGNPYIVEGCSDVDECRDATLNNCQPDQKCINELGTFFCDGYQEIVSAISIRIYIQK